MPRQGWTRQYRTTPPLVQDGDLPAILAGHTLGYTKWTRGSDVASGGAITLPTDGNLFKVTGTTNITSITAVAGLEVRLWFAGILTVVNGGNLRLDGDYVTAVDRTLTLACYDGTNWYEVSRSHPTPPASGGTVTSVAMTVPAELSVSGSPITTAGTLAITKANQSANQIYAGPASGAAAVPGFRAAVLLDLPGVPACRAYNSTNISLTNATLTVLALDSEAFDSDTMHDLVTSNSRVTIKTAGKYLFVGSVEFAGNATGVRIVQLLKNGASLVQESDMPGIATAHSVVCPMINDFAVNDYIELRAYQNSGGALNATADAQIGIGLSAARIGA